MDVMQIVARMEENAQVILHLAAGVSQEQARWRPTPDDWSLLEVINHLYDEEREDFRARVDCMLHRPDEEFTPIHPGAWVTERRYNERDLAESLAGFLAEREASITWLAGLTDAAWTTAREHPVVGRFTAGDLLASWPAHDFLHIRQLNELHYLYHAHTIAPRRIDYAGEW